MKFDTRRGTFEDVVRGRTPLAANICYRLRDLIEEVYPDVTEQPRPAEEHANYAIGPEKDAESFGYLCPLRDYVRLGFFYGAALPDPAGLLIGTGKRLRHIKVYSLEQAEQPEIRQLLEAAVRERKEALGMA